MQEDPGVQRLASKVDWRRRESTLIRKPTRIVLGVAAMSTYNLRNSALPDFGFLREHTSRAGVVSIRSNNQTI
jgi:hypothetical protein